jgi:hypothetical protein
LREGEEGGCVNDYSFCGSCEEMEGLGRGLVKWDRLINLLKGKVFGKKE